MTYLEKVVYLQNVLKIIVGQVQQEKQNNLITKTKKMKKRNYVYDYEITPQRKFWDNVQHLVNCAITITVFLGIVGMLIFGIASSIH